jgi:hypothetical protein
LGSTLNGLPGSARAAAEGSLAGALGVANELGAAGGLIANAAKQAFVDGMSIAFIVGAVVVAIAAVVAGKLLPAEIDEAEHAPAVTELERAVAVAGD